VLALGSTLGAAKVDAMRLPIADIAPDCRVQAIDDFITPDNLEIAGAGRRSGRSSTRSMRPGPRRP
jgi:tRNA A37 threonylcarbamoyladenosine dehydratase